MFLWIEERFVGIFFWFSMFLGPSFFDYFVDKILNMFFY